jgi:sec-independent protein translocase protein TatA
MFFRNPTTDVILVIVVLLLFFGPKRLPLLGRELGRGMREFKDSITGDHKDRDDDEDKPALTAATGQTDTAPASQPAGRPEPEHTPAETAPEPRS